MANEALSKAATEKTPDLRDEIMKAVEVSETSEKSAQESKGEESPPKNSPKEPEVKTEAKEEIPQESQEKPQQDVKGEGNTDESSEDKKPDAEQSDELDAPSHWALEDQEMFRKQDSKAQRWLLDRSKAMDAAHTKRSQEIAPLRNSIQKWQPYLDKVGATPELAFESLITAEYRLRTGTPEQKREALAKVAQDYGIPLGGPETEQSGGEEDYLQQDILKVVQPLQEQVDQLTQGVQTQSQAAQQAQTAQAAEYIQSFREAKTEAGQPAHPYFDEVYQDMTVFAQADQAGGKLPELPDLYERAVWANPAVRVKMLAAQQHAAKKQEERARKEKVEKAKLAGSSVAGASAVPEEQPKSLRDNISEQFDRYPQ